MTNHSAKPVARLQPVFSRRNALLNSNLQLQAEVAALTEDNKQLRAALSIYREVARRTEKAVPVQQVA